MLLIETLIHIIPNMLSIERTEASLQCWIVAHGRGLPPVDGPELGENYTVRTLWNLLSNAFFDEFALNGCLASNVSCVKYPF